MSRHQRSRTSRTIRIVTISAASIAVTFAVTAVTKHAGWDPGKWVALVVAGIVIATGVALGMSRGLAGYVAVAVVDAGIVLGGISLLSRVSSPPAPNRIGNVSEHGYAVIHLFGPVGSSGLDPAVRTLIWLTLELMALAAAIFVAMLVSAVAGEAVSRLSRAEPPGQIDSLTAPPGPTPGEPSD